MLHDKLSSLFIIIALGYLAGKIKVYGLSFGASAVMFAALGMGYLGYQVPDGIGTLGLVLFVYCLGISAGPSFLRVFSSHGKVLAGMGLAVIVAGVATAWAVARVVDLPVDLACGIFAGAMTSTPALAATSEVLPADSQLAVGFGIAYPFGVLGVVLFVQLLPRLLGSSYAQLELEAGHPGSSVPIIQRRLIEVLNPAVAGRKLADMEPFEQANCQVTRVLVEDRLRPVPPDFAFALGQVVLAVGAPPDTQLICDLLGKPSDRTDLILETDAQRRKVVVSSKEIVGKSLLDLKLLSQFGVTVPRITRHEFEFVPRSKEVIQFADALTVVGEPDSLERFSRFAGHRAKAFDETNIISLSIGILLGVGIGKIGFEFGGHTIALGMAGGPLLVGLTLGHFGQIGPLVGHLPRAARLLLTELGLSFFLIDAGISAGSQLGPVLREHGLVLGVSALLITIVPMVVGFVVGRHLLRLSLLQVLGGICGGMTSTPGLGVLNAKTDSDVPIVSYAAVYPLGLLLVTVLARVLVSLLS